MKKEFFAVILMAVITFVCAISCHAKSQDENIPVVQTTVIAEAEVTTVSEEESLTETTETSPETKEETVTTTKPQTTKGTTTATTTVTTKEVTTTVTEKPVKAEKFDINKIPAYSGKAYVEVNGNKPYFTADEITAKSFERYSDLDKFGRCGVTIASVGKDIMPTEERGAIGQVKPTGWHTVKYEGVDGKYLYNRCHLIGFQLTGENANVKNLITGTRYLNIEGMLPFENMVADFVKETGNHVMYRVTPIFRGDNLLADGVLMEGYSVEDKGEGIEFCVFAYNAQPDIIIDYKTGESKRDEVTTTKPHETKPHRNPPPESETTVTTTAIQAGKEQTYILNTSSKKFHYPTCPGVKTMSEKNKAEVKSTRQDLINQGYSPCGNCNP